ncbi:MAG: ribonuclease R [Alphaproteobacteria bacterium]|nr:ribonuclease R [Alphaproteobacteria bacterium]
MRSRRRAETNRKTRSSVPSAGLPSPAALIEFLRDNPEAAGTREIARAFGLGPADHPGLRRILRNIARSGELVRGGDRRFAAGASLPEMMQVERSGSDADGFPLVRPVSWPGPGEAPLFRLVEGAAGGELPEGARALARLVRRESGETEAEPVRRLDTQEGRVVGVFRRTRDGGEVVSTDRRDRGEYRVLGRDAAGVPDGELVVAEALPTRRFGGKRARVVERLGPADAPGSISRLTVAAFDIPDEFPREVLAEADAAKPVNVDGRADLREFALVTIDGEDARDFDDAVWAAPVEDAKNRGGWHIVVAIADVSHYVRPSSALDREAEHRGNSVYFPDRVVPMLPEALSNELCSLKPGEDRACVAAHLWIDASGRKKRHRFERGLMRSAARLTYEAVQAAHDAPAGTLPIGSERLDALYGAFAALDRARRARGALELDLTEHRVLLDEARQPVAVVPRHRLDSHRLIEEFMILANVAAAEELEGRHQPCMYRVHDAPDPAKLDALRDFLDELGIPGLALAKGQVIRPALFNRILEKVRGTPEAPIVNELVLRSQAQAIYSPNNIGHFGLALPRYAHFTSPIRRYADLVVHRALTAQSGRPPLGGDALAAVADHISMTERRAASAERGALDRYRATLLGAAIGTVYEARITGVAPFGFFISLPESGADGLVPVSTLPSDYYDHDARRHRLVGRRHGRQFALGDGVTVRLVEADPVGGRLLFRLEAEPMTRAQVAATRRGRGPRRRG